MIGQCSGEAWTARYERLRAEALRGNKVAALDRGLGLVLLLHQGLAGWMAAWERLAPLAPPTAVPREAAPVLRADLGGQLAEILAGLILREFQGAK